MLQNEVNASDEIKENTKTLLNNACGSLRAGLELAELDLNLKRKI
jgi:hypothetical protein